jgi:hypothetical protein
MHVYCLSPVEQRKLTYLVAYSVQHPQPGADWLRVMSCLLGLLMDELNIPAHQTAAFLARLRTMELPEPPPDDRDDTDLLLRLRRAKLNLPAPTGRGA